MSVELILHNRNQQGVWIIDIHQVFELMGIINHRSSFGHLHSSETRHWLTEHKQIGTPLRSYLQL